MSPLPLPAPDAVYKKDDRQPWKTTLTADDISDLSTVTAVDLFMRKRLGSANVIDGGSCTIESATALAINAAYSPTAGDVDEVGRFQAYWRATFPGGITARFPTDKSWNEIEIQPTFE